MKGIVDQAGRAILEIRVRSDSHEQLQTIAVWIDTGFTGDLVLPQKTVHELALTPSGTVDGVLADGSQTLLTTYHCEIEWFGKIRSLEVIANSGVIPLLGVGLLLAKELIVDYNGRWVYSIDKNGQSAQIFAAKDGQPLAQLSFPVTHESDWISNLYSGPSGRWIVMSVYSKVENKERTYRLYVFDSETWKIDPPGAVIDIADPNFTNIEFITDSTFSIFVDNMTGDEVWRFYRHGSGLIEVDATFPYTFLPGEQGAIGESAHDDTGELVYHWSGAVAQKDPTKAFALANDGRLFNAKTGAPVLPALGTRYPPDLVRFAIDGRLVYVIGKYDVPNSMIDTATGKKLPARVPENYVPGVGFIGRTGAPVHFGPARWPDIDAGLLQLWAQVAVRGELGPDGEFVKWNEETWEQKRQELAAVKPPYEDFPFPGYVATDKLHWLRAEYEAANDDKEKVRLVDELLRRSEACGDKSQVVRWQNERAKYITASMPTE